jgi:hypothetical protein
MNLSIRVDGSRELSVMPAKSGDEKAADEAAKAAAEARTAKEKALRADVVEQLRQARKGEADPKAAMVAALRALRFLLDGDPT